MPNIHARWRVKAKNCGVELASGFKHLWEANDWHDLWCDSFEDDSLRPACTFERYDALTGQPITASSLLADIKELTAN